MERRPDPRAYDGRPSGSTAQTTRLAVMLAVYSLAGIGIVFAIAWAFEAAPR